MAKEATTTTTEAPQTQTAEPTVQTVLDAPAAESTAATDGGQGETQDGGEPQMQTVLDRPADEGQAPANGKPDEGKPGESQPDAEAEAYKSLLADADKAEAIVVGKGFGGEEIKFGAAELKALYPALQQAGIPADKASAVAKSVAALEGARLKAENVSYVKAINAKADECKAKFGADMDRVKANAVKGLNMMDKSLREELYATPVLLNDHRFLAFLAQVGEKFAIDDGGGAGASPSAGSGGYNPRNWVSTSNRT